MTEKMGGIKEYQKNRSECTLRKVEEAIRELSFKGEKINFSSVAKSSGVSKTYLYQNSPIKDQIEGLRNKQIDKSINQRSRYDKTSKSKDIIITAKDKKIACLEAENRKLMSELVLLRGKIYQQMKLT